MFANPERYPYIFSMRLTEQEKTILDSLAAQRDVRVVAIVHDAQARYIAQESDAEKEVSHEEL